MIGREVTVAATSAEGVSTVTTHAGTSNTLTGEFRLSIFSVTAVEDLIQGRLSALTTGVVDAVAATATAASHDHLLGAVGKFHRDNGITTSHTGTLAAHANGNVHRVHTGTPAHTTLKDVLTGTTTASTTESAVDNRAGATATTTACGGNQEHVQSIRDTKLAIRGDEEAASTTNSGTTLLEAHQLGADILNSVNEIL